MSLVWLVHLPNAELIMALLEPGYVQVIPSVHSPP